MRGGWRIENRESGRLVPMKTIKQTNKQDEESGQKEKRKEEKNVRRLEGGRKEDEEA